ncbi:MAG: hypothetical protein ACXW20_20385 [Burkholderiales bacterium]
MSDRAPRIADFFLATRGMPEDARRAELTYRFPGLAPDELRRSIAIAQELLCTEAGEYFAGADALEFIRQIGADRRS